MVEGPGVHRVAIAHKKILLGQKYAAYSPNGKFEEGAAAINGRLLSHIEAHGKNIFYFFTKDKVDDDMETSLLEDAIVVHIHFGMSGSFRTFTFPGPEPRPATRLRLIDEKKKIVAHLSANVCQYGGIQLYSQKIEKLGPDLLRNDADKERFWTAVQKSRKTIGALIMDQSVIAGIGNIYRTELLFVVGVHPETAASTISRPTFEAIWTEAKRLLQVGVATGSIITVFPDEAGKSFSRLKKGEKRYVYNHKNCKRCNGLIKSWKSGQRRVYACEACQPLISSDASELPKEIQLTKEEIDQNNDTSVTDISKASPQSKKLVSLAAHRFILKDESSRDKKRRKRIVVEHQAFKDITTGGGLDIGSLDNDIMEALAPATPEKPVPLLKPIDAQKRKLEICQ